jgi:hypothetical protein
VRGELLALLLFTAGRSTGSGRTGKELSKEQVGRPRSRTAKISPPSIVPSAVSITPGVRSPYASLLLERLAADGLDTHESAGARGHSNAPRNGGSRVSWLVHDAPRPAERCRSYTCRRRQDVAPRTRQTQPRRNQLTAHEARRGLPLSATQGGKMGSHAIWGIRSGVPSPDSAPAKEGPPGSCFQPEETFSHAREREREDPRTSPVDVVGERTTRAGPLPLGDLWFAEVL